MLRIFWSASSSRMPFFATMPMTMIMPMKDEMLNVVRVTRSATKTPEVDRSAEERIATGAENSPNSNSNTRNSRRIARIRTSTRSRNDCCCSA